MSTVEDAGSRGVLVTLVGVAVGIAALALGWFLVLQPLLDPVPEPSVATADGVAGPDGVAGTDGVAPGVDAAPDPGQPGPAREEIDDLLALGAVSEEVFQIAGARDPFRQVVVEAQVDQPSTPGTSTPGTSTPGTSTPGTSTPGTSTPGTSTPGTSTPGTSTPGTSAPGAGGSNGSAGGGTGPAGVTELAATGMDLPVMVGAMLLMLGVGALMLVGSAARVRPSGGAGLTAGDRRTV